MADFKAFTGSSPAGLLRQLQSPCAIAAAFDPAVLPHPPLHEFQAIWDTGATNSSISQAVIDGCGLKPTGKAQVIGANSTDLCDTYLINLGLPNTVGIPSLRVTRLILSKGIDVLIGMDVIVRGDFAITNLGGNTVFSFCMPSYRRIDYVDELQKLAKQQTNRPGFRNYNPHTPKKHK
jgi:hypothetical protein